MALILDVLLAIYSLFLFSLFVTDYSFVHPHVSINNILAPTIGLVFLLLLRWLIDKNNFKNSIIVSCFLRFKGLSDKNLVVLLFVFTFLFFSIMSIARHFSLSSSGYDLGIFDQAIWNVTQGNSLFCTIKYSQGGSLLGDHFEPILFFIAPLYLLWPNVLVLLILQSLLLASAIIPLYLIANLIIKDRFVIFAFLICYVLSKPLRGIAFNDFHPESIMVPDLFWGYYFLIKRNNVLLWVSIIILLLCKEDTTFLVLGFGLFTLISQQRKWLGASFIALSIFLWWLESGILIPYFSPTHKYEYLGKLPFGATYLDNLKFCLFHPLLLIKFLFTKAKINYVLRLLGPLCFLSLLSPPHFILIFIPLFKNLLATAEKSMWIPFIGINEHYVAGVIPFVFIGAIYGCHELLQKLKIESANVVVGLFLIWFTLLFFSKTDGVRFTEFLNNIKINHTLEKIKSLELIPSGSSVLTTGDLSPHLSHRKFIYLWDNTGGQLVFPEYIAIDKATFGNQYVSSNENSIFANYLSIAKSKGYKVIANIQNGNFLILTHPKI